MPKQAYKVRGRPEKNLNYLRRERAYKRGASRPGTTPGYQWRRAGVRFRDPPGYGPSASEAGVKP